MQKYIKNQSINSKENPLQCQTKYPILLVHGIGARHRRFFNYWGRIPKVLQKNGAVIFYSHQDAWGSLNYNALIIKQDLLIYYKKPVQKKSML